MRAHIGRARLVGAVTNAIAEVDVVAEAVHIGHTATQGRGEIQHIGDADFLVD